MCSNWNKYITLKAKNKPQNEYYIDENAENSE